MRPFAYAPLSASCILNGFHPLKLFLTHRHHFDGGDEVWLQSRVHDFAASALCKACLYKKFFSQDM
jgi:hypothetical protein